MRRMLLLALCGVLLGWLARGFLTSPDAPPAPAPAAPIVAGAAPPAPPAQRIAHAELPFASGGKRNLFAYREAARVEEPRAFVVVEDPPPAVAVSAPVAAIEPAPQQPPFPYRLIGTFGTREKRFAAFARDGEVLAVRAGRNIGSDYVLRSIGIESVEVQRVADASSLRVPLGEPR